MNRIKRNRSVDERILLSVKFHLPTKLFLERRMLIIKIKISLTKKRDKKHTNRYFSNIKVSIFFPTPTFFLVYLFNAQNKTWKKTRLTNLGFCNCVTLAWFSYESSYKDTSSFLVNVIKQH